MPIRVLVTGGSGLVGRAFQRMLKGRNDRNYQYRFLSSSDGDLCDRDICEKIYKEYGPDIVVHLAARVGGIFYNMSHNLDMFLDNMKMSMNIMEMSKKYRVQRTIVCLSTCIFPNSLDEMTLEDLHKGPPHDSNYGYAYAKRNLQVMCRLFNEATGNNGHYEYIVPCNIFGPEDNFNETQSHVIPALILQCERAIQDNLKTLELRGTGTAKRQFVYVDDVVRVIMSRLNLVEKASDVEGHVIAPPTEYTISEVSQMIAQEMGYIGNIVFDGDSTCDGQMRKLIRSNVELPNGWVSLQTGLLETIRKRI